MASTSFRLIELLNQRLINPFLLNDTLFNLSPVGRRHDQLIEIICSFANNVIETRRVEILKASTTATQEAKKRPTLMDILLQSTLDGASLSNDDIRGEVNTFVFAGYETTTKATQFLLYLLAKNPDAQARAYDEIERVVIQPNAPLNIHTLNSLAYLDLCIKETLRMYPPVPIVGKACNEDLRFDNMTIPANMPIMMMIYPNHVNEKYFSRPEKFEPERFEGEFSNTERNPFCYTPFSAGLRNCVGE